MEILCQALQVEAVCCTFSQKIIRTSTSIIKNPKTDRKRALDVPFHNTLSSFTFESPPYRAHYYL